MNATIHPTSHPGGALSDWPPIEPPTTPEPGPWKVALVTSALSAATGWALDGIAQSLRSNRRRRR